MPRNSNLKIAPVEKSKAIHLLSRKGSWRQYPAYSEIAAERVSSVSQYYKITDNDEDLAIFNLRTRSLPLGLGALSLISHGPVLLRASQFWHEDLACSFEALGEFAARTGREIRIDPDPLWQLHGLSPMLPERAYEDRRARAYHTIILPIGDGIHAVRQRLHGKWRNTLKQSEKAGLRTVVSADPADFARMTPLLDELISRKGFAINQDSAFFARAARTACGTERLLITLVHAGDDVVSAHIGAYSGNMACYLLGATSPQGRHLRAAYAAQWAAIEAAIGLGLQWYDLGGIDPVDNPDVYHFKKRMGGQEVMADRAIVLPAGRWRGYLTGAAQIAWRMLSR